MTDGQARWDQLSEELVAAEPAISRSTMMGLPCLRVQRSVTPWSSPPRTSHK